MKDEILDVLYIYKNDNNKCLIMVLCDTCVYEYFGIKSFNENVFEFFENSIDLIFFNEISLKNSKFLKIKDYNNDNNNNFNDGIYSICYLLGKKKN
jgi:hypothetical protein